MWMTIKDLAVHLGVSVKTIRRRLSKGEWESKKVKEGIGSPTTYVLFVKSDKATITSTDDLSKVDTSKVDTSKVDTPKVDTPKVDTSVGQFDKPLSQEDLKFSDETKEIEFKYPEEKKDNNLTGQEKKPDNHPQAGADSSSAPVTPTSLQETKAIVPEIVEGYFVAKKNLDLRPNYNMPQKYMKQAELRGFLCEEVLQVLRTSKSKMKAWESITVLYNSGNLVRDLYIIEGNKSTRSLRRFVKDYLDSGKDVLALAPAYSDYSTGHNVPMQTMSTLLEIVLNPNQVSIGSAVTSLVALYDKMDIPLPCSPRTMRRALEKYKTDNYDRWVYIREGLSAFRDKIGKIIMRNANLLNVGDVWVGDGHTPAFDIINPHTGKPKRPTLIVQFDWASRFPVGCEINFTETSDSIKCSLRNGALNAGYLPHCNYLDNGRAFKAKVFTAHPEKHNLEEELSGIFYRSGMCSIWALPYNARAKVVERFFETMQNNFERLISSWRGANVTDKPATLKRNEKWLIKMFERKPLTVDEFKEAFNWWVYEIYGRTPHRGLNGRKPLEVFEEGNKKIDPVRKITPQDLNFLMLSMKKKKISNKGINLFGLFFWDENLVKYVGQQAFIQYDTMNLESILVYTEKKQKFICQAAQDIKMHPLYLLADDPVKTKAELDRAIKQQRRIQKQVKQSSERELERISKTSDKITIDFTPKGQLFNNTPMLDIPKKQPKKSLQEITTDQMGQSSDFDFNIRKRTKIEDEEVELNPDELGFNINR
jgi:putative transposase